MNNTVRENHLSAMQSCCSYRRVLYSPFPVSILTCRYEEYLAIFYIKSYTCMYTQFRSNSNLHVSGFTSKNVILSRIAPLPSINQHMFILSTLWVVVLWILTIDQSQGMAKTSPFKSLLLVLVLLLMLPVVQGLELRCRLLVLLCVALSNPIAILAHAVTAFDVDVITFSTVARIVGGSDADPMRYPYHATVVRSVDYNETTTDENGFQTTTTMVETLYCGGSLMYVLVECLTVQVL